MSALGKDKNKADNIVSVISNTESEKVLISTITMIELKQDTLIKIRKLTIFSKNRSKFSAYKISVGLYMWANNKKERLNRILKTVLEQVA
jgi:hypothetical protein